MVRPAGPGDAEAVVAVRRAAWLAAYGSFVGVGFPRPPEEEAAVWHERIARGDVWVAGAPDGFASVDGCELTTLYVRPEAWGRGLGDALHAVAVAALRARGCTSARLWVFEANVRGRRFYERRGWTAEPGVRDDGGGTWAAVALRYRLDLTAASPRGG